MPRLTVHVDGKPYEVVPGTEVHELRTLLPPETQQALLTGLARFIDRFGNEVGPGGGLHDGQEFFVAYFA